jgi:hypothetical protein
LAFSNSAELEKCSMWPCTINIYCEPYHITLNSYLTTSLIKLTHGSVKWIRWWKSMAEECLLVSLS